MEESTNRINALYKSGIRVRQISFENKRKNMLPIICELVLVIINMICICVNICYKNYFPVLWNLAAAILCAISLCHYITKMERTNQYCKITEQLINYLRLCNCTSMSLEELIFHYHDFALSNYPKQILNSDAYLSWLTNSGIFPDFHISYDTERVIFYARNMEYEASCSKISPRHTVNEKVADAEEKPKAKTKTEESSWEWSMPHLLKELSDCEFGASIDRELEKEAMQTGESLEAIYYTELGKKLGKEALERFYDRYLNPLSQELRRWGEIADIMSKMHPPLSDMEMENKNIPESVKELRLNLIKTLQAVRNAANEIQMEILVTQADTANANLKTIQSVLSMDGYNRPMKVI